MSYKQCVPDRDPDVLLRPRALVLRVPVRLRLLLRVPVPLRLVLRVPVPLRLVLRVPVRLRLVLRAPVRLRLLVRAPVRLRLLLPVRPRVLLLERLVPLRLLEELLRRLRVDFRALLPVSLRSGTLAPFSRASASSWLAMTTGCFAVRACFRRSRWAGVSTSPSFCSSPVAATMWSAGTVSSTS